MKNGHRKDKTDMKYENEKVCHCEMCSSGREERQFAHSKLNNEFILWDIEEASAFNKWLDTPKEKEFLRIFLLWNSMKNRHIILRME